MKIFIITLSTFFLCTVISHAGDWPKFLGPNDNDIIKVEKVFNADLKEWEKKWEIKIGIGYSAIAVSGKKAFTLGHDGKETETLYCLDTEKGKELWKFSYKGLLINKLHFGGPNATPTIDGEKVYSISKDGQLFCLSKADGKLIWRQDLLKVLKIKQPSFGFAGSPVIHHGNVYVTCGRATAIDKKSGAVQWVSKITKQEEDSYLPGHATPVIFTRGSQTFLLLQLGTGLEVLNVIDGSFITRYDLKAAYKMTATTPLVFDQGRKIILTWNRYSTMLNFDGKKLTKGWKTKELIQSMQNNVLYGNTLLATSGTEGGKRVKMVAVDVNTGKFLWEEKGFNWAQLTGVNQTLLCMGVTGELSTVKVSDKAFTEISRIKILDNICWTKATYAGGCIYLRNNKGRVLCLGVK